MVTCGSAPTARSGPRPRSRSRPRCTYAIAEQLVELAPEDAQRLGHRHRRSRSTVAQNGTRVRGARPRAHRRPGRHRVPRRRAGRASRPTRSPSRLIEVAARHDRPRRRRLLRAVVDPDRQGAGHLRRRVRGAAGARRLRAQAARPLPGPLRAQPGRAVRARCSRWPRSSSSPPRSRSAPPPRSASCSGSRPRSRSSPRSAALALLPFGDVQHVFGRRIGIYGIDVSIGPLYVFALAGISFYGIMLGGWASGSKYSFLGAMRGAAQLISYEVSQGLALVGVVISAQTLSLTGIVHAQRGHVVRRAAARGLSHLHGGVVRGDQPGAVRPRRGRRRARRRATSPSTGAPGSSRTCSPST